MGREFVLFDRFVSGGKVVGFWRIWVLNFFLWWRDHQMLKKEVVKKQAVSYSWKI